MINIKTDFKEVKARLKAGQLKANDIPKLLAKDFPGRAKGPIATQITKAYPGQPKGNINAVPRYGSTTSSLEYRARGWQSIKHFKLAPAQAPMVYIRSGKQRWPVKPAPYTISFTIRKPNMIGGEGSGIFIGMGSLHGHVYKRKGNSATSALQRVEGIAVPVMITNAAREGINEKVRDILEKREQNYLNQMFG